MCKVLWDIVEMGQNLLLLGSKGLEVWEEEKLWGMGRGDSDLQGQEVLSTVWDT